MVSDYLSIGDDWMASMADQDTLPAGSLSIDDESNLDFIAGFPCSNYRCSGTLVRGEHDGAPAIVCSGCEDIFYVLQDPT